MITDKYLLQLKNEFGKYGSWALWDGDGKIEPFIRNKNFISKIKPTIVFMGLNASRDLREEVDWANFHSDLKYKKGRSWKKASCRRLAEIIQKEFPQFHGAYMTDIIKTQYDSASGNLIKFLQGHKGVFNKNQRLLKREMDLLKKILGSSKPTIICMGNDSFKILSKLENNIRQIPHYGMHGSDKEVRKKIRRALKKLDILF